MQLFSAENLKKTPSKVGHNRSPIFLCTGPAAQMAQEQKSRTTKSPLMQDWVFRLGLCQYLSNQRQESKESCNAQYIY